MAGQIILAIRRGDERREHPLTAGTVTIGRAPENTVVLDDRDVSAHHARIECVDGGLCLTDLGSKCSTRLNEVTLSPHTPCRFTEGKHAQIGPFILSLHGATALAQTETIVAVPGFAGESTIVDAPPPPPGIVSAAGDARATVL